MIRQLQAGKPISVNYITIKTNQRSRKGDAVWRRRNRRARTDELPRGIAVRALITLIADNEVIITRWRLHDHLDPANRFFTLNIYTIAKNNAKLARSWLSSQTGPWHVLLLIVSQTTITVGIW